MIYLVDSHGHPLSDRKAAPCGPERRCRIVALGFMVCVQQITVGEMFDDVSPRITPVVEDLATEDVAADTGVVVVAGARQVIMAGHERIHILYLEGRMVETGLTDSDTQKRVVIRIVIAAVTTHEGGDDVLGLAEIDLIGGQEAKT